MCSKVLNGHIILTDTSITTILAPEMTYTPKYVIVLEPQRSPYGYYLLTAYYLNMPGGEKKMKKMLKKKLEEVL